MHLNAIDISVLFKVKKNEQTKEPEIAKLQEGLFNLREIDEVGNFILVKSGSGICIGNQCIPGAILAINSNLHVRKGNTVLFAEGYLTEY